VKVYVVAFFVGYCFDFFAIFSETDVVLTGKCCLLVFCIYDRSCATSARPSQGCDGILQRLIVYLGCAFEARRLELHRDFEQALIRSLLSKRSNFALENGFRPKGRKEVFNSMTL
jgi:hypothetical protein